MKCSQLFGLKMAESRTISESTFTKSENTSSDEEQEPPCRSVGRPRVPFEEASKKTKRRRVAELTTVRSANELQFAVNVVSGSNHSEVSPQVFSFSTAEALALMVDLDIKVALQELVQKTAESILEIINVEERDCRIKVICKWGFDGSSGHSQYKQKFSDLENTDEFLFLVAMTPLRLIDMDTNKVLWKN
ncbi:unnamed protein product [Acanthoscelides obtectus]|uniref:Uncharacterized protein n=1 Tax=Acanthoscelides obtectus TaxID=200917 RepID=A0A9P0PJ88_ACAOB|nr:unnamed protein product [Acanthoscelides obtectus]CAK1661728.1 hypothetical protein AOBTE_LOCUS22758 [Acanthoscelides obtectus]